jgi:Zn-dependent protease/predicted transcriptional regulator
MKALIMFLDPPKNTKSYHIRVWQVVKTAGVLYDVGMRFQGLHLVRVWGIQIVIDYSWFVVFFLLSYTMSQGYFPQVHKEFTTPQYWMMGMITALLVFVSVLVHELSHSFVALKQGIRVSSIRLFIFGGVAQIESEPSSGRHEFLIALAGPATSMALVFFFGATYLVLSIRGGLAPVAAVSLHLSYANLLLVLFNLIPGFPLDGGRILRAILWDRWNDAARATRVVSQIGSAFALFLMILGALQAFVAQNLISGIWLIFIGLFMKQAAVGSYQTVALRQALVGVRVQDVMTKNLVSVDWLTPVDQLVQDYVYKHHFTNFPVFDRDEFVGMVSLTQVKGVPKELWAFKQVRDILTPAEQLVTLKPTDDASEALSRMIMADTGRLAVMEEGRLVGIVSRRDIMNLFKIKSDLGMA